MVNFITSTVISIIKFLFLVLKNLPKAQKRQEKTNEDVETITEVINDKKIEEEIPELSQIAIIEKELREFEEKIKRANTTKDKWDVLIENSDNEKERELMRRLRDISD
jgi:hypothetical protein